MLDQAEEIKVRKAEDRQAERDRDVLAGIAYAKKLEE